VVQSLLSTLQEKKNKLYNFLLSSVFILNIADALLSYHFISKKKILEEANPVWIPIIYSNPILFLFLKITSVSLLCYLLYKTERNSLSFLGISACFIVYVSIITGFLTLCIL
jgi:hypothetical protein